MSQVEHFNQNIVQNHLDLTELLVYLLLSWLQMFVKLFHCLDVIKKLV